MPYIRVDPELRLEHLGVEVFPLYDEVGPCRYWFTTDPDNADDFLGHGRNGQFDARQLEPRWSDTPTVAEWERFWKPRFQNEEEAIDALIRSGIESGRVSNITETQGK